MDHYEMKLFYSREDRGWVAVAPELPGCSAHGGTPEKALDELKVAMRGWLAVAREDRAAVPEPIADRGLQGRVLLRLPKTLHRELLEEAASEGVSLNQYLLYCLSARGRRRGVAPAAARFIDARGVPMPKYKAPVSFPVIVADRSGPRRPRSRGR